jgi:hypothetical protein
VIAVSEGANAVCTGLAVVCGLFNWAAIALLIERIKESGRLAARMALGFGLKALNIFTALGLLIRTGLDDIRLPVIPPYVIAEPN